MNSFIVAGAEDKEFCDEDFLTTHKGIIMLNERILRIASTTNNPTGTIARLFLGLVLLPHGAQKLLGAFGGYGFSGTMSFFTDTVHLPWIVGFAVICIEFFGSAFLIAGLLSRVWSVAFIGLMTGIIFTSHVQNGFFMNWSGAQGGEGFEYHLLVIGLAIVTLINGSGAFSLDSVITTSRYKTERRSTPAHQHSMSLR